MSGSTVVRTPRRVAFASAIGTTIEWYDFYLYATASALVFNKVFFSSVDPATGTLAAFATFAAGFGARPIGAVVAGHLGDRIGRKAVLVGALLLMGGASTLIGLLPTYATIGVLAPALLVVLRTLQGLAVGAEWGGAAILTVEHAPPGRRGWFGGFTQIGSPAGMLLATGVFWITRTAAGPEAFLAWAWRLPFLLSVVLVGVGLAVRLRLRDAPEFQRLRDQGGVARLPVLEVLRAAPVPVLLTTGLRLSQIGLYVMLTTYGLSYISANLGEDSDAGLIAVVVSSAVSIGTTLVWGGLTDRFGRKRPYLFGAVGAVAALALFFLAVDTGSTVLIVLAVVLATSVFFDAMAAGQPAWFSELFPLHLRYSGVSLGYQIGSVLAGGFTPLIAAALVLAGDGRPWWVLLYYAGLAAVTITCAALARETAFEEQLDRT
ncbi:sugar phosphate permease [Actinokineospora spheciospongiae]|nr:sugar phosphate permease [Actinokineospora spheciospongiae]